MTAKLKRFKRVYYFRGDWENGFFALWLWPFAMGITLLSAAFILHPVGPALISSMVKFLCSFFFSAIACYVWYHTFKLFYACFCQFKAYYEEVKE